jgi:hypothetical protein
MVSASNHAGHDQLAPRTRECSRREAITEATQLRWFEIPGKDGG